jgi:hypothetical protein
VNTLWKEDIPGAVRNPANSFDFDLTVYLNPFVSMDGGPCSEPSPAQFS